MINFFAVNDGDYIKAVLDRNLAENISRVLYPNDNVRFFLLSIDFIKYSKFCFFFFPLILCISGNGQSHFHFANNRQHNFLNSPSQYQSIKIAGVPGEKPQVTSDKLPDSPSKFPCFFSCE